VTLDGTYERTLREIKETKWESARRLLVCVTVASRPLQVEELAEILAFDFKLDAIPKFRKDWRLKNPVEAVLSACSTLLSVINFEGPIKRFRVVQFAHFTVKEFLTSRRFAEKYDSMSRRYHISISSAHTFVAQACLGMLLHLDKNVTSQSLTQFPLAEYAAHHWFEHARFEGVLQHEVEGMTQPFDRTKPDLSIWLWIYDPTNYWRRLGPERAERPPPPCRTPLHYAAFCGLHDLAKILAIEYPQDVNSESLPSGSSPLYLAARGGHVDLARMLIEHGADVSAQTKDEWTALHEASENGHVNVARTLVECGADMSAQTENGRTALHWASQYGHVNLALMLVEYGANVSAQAEDGLTALHLASHNGQGYLVWMLLVRGAEVSAQTENGWTALHMASWWGHVDIVWGLIEYGADVSAQMKDGWTALHLASCYGHVDVAWVLVVHGADVSTQTEDGLTALHLASENGHADLARMLTEHGTKMATPGNPTDHNYNNT